MQFQDKKIEKEKKKMEENLLKNKLSKSFTPKLVPNNFLLKND